MFSFYDYNTAGKLLCKASYFHLTFDLPWKNFSIFFSFENVLFFILTVIWCCTNDISGVDVTRGYDYKPHHESNFFKNIKFTLKNPLVRKYVNIPHRMFIFIREHAHPLLAIFITFTPLYIFLISTFYYTLFQFVLQFQFSLLF